MAYCDYGAFVWLNGKRREDKEDVATFATDEETFGTSSNNVPKGKKAEWVNHIHHGIMGDGDIRVICHEQGLPSIYEATEDGFKEIEYHNEDVDYFEYEINFEYKGYKFYFVSDRPYYAKMTTPKGDVWECKYDYWYGAGF